MTAAADPSAKQILRDAAQAARNKLENKDGLSAIILNKFLNQPEYATARTVMYYISIRSEVRTRAALPAALESGKRIVVPWCNAQGELELFHLTSMEELSLGTFQILEPKPEFRKLREKHLPPDELDLVMVPGVAFDRRGGRAGYGKGYYDKLLQHVRKDTLLTALAFECQLFPELPMTDHDVFMDKVITELATYPGKGR
jgi:5-formyltetrahydrofolate cyclo-ligase